MEDVVLHGVELHLTENGGLLLAVDVEVDGEDLGGVDELAHSLVGEGQVSGQDATAVLDFDELLALFEGALVGEFDDFTAIEDSGDFAFCAERLGGFLAQFHTGSSLQFVRFHSVEIFCVTQN